MQGQQQGQPGQYQQYIQHQQQYQQMQQPQMNYQMQHHQHQRQKIDKPIKATEIKSYLHAWCTKRGEKPEYTYEANGKPPKVRYQCKLTIPTVGTELNQEASSKKAAQTQVAWAYIDLLIGKGLVNQQELPPRPAATNGQPNALASGVGGVGGGISCAHVDLTKYGGYSTENARQRLNRFCVQHGLVCNITNEVGGTPHTKTTTAKLTLMVNGTAFNAEATSSNKKSANAQCSMEMLAHLFAHALIKTKEEEAAISAANKPQKRKVDEDDEHGNWNIETALGRLKEFEMEMNGKDGFVNQLTITKEDMLFKGVCRTCFAGFEFVSENMGGTEEQAEKRVAFENVSKMYKAGILQPRKNEPHKAPKRVKEVVMSGEDGRASKSSMHIKQTDHIMLPRWGSGRMTPWDDRHIKSKLVQLEHTIEEKTALRDMAIFVEQALKTTSDALEREYNIKDNPHYVDIPENRILVGVMRVGDFAKGLLLKEEMHVELCVSSRDKPTRSLLSEVGELLRKHVSFAPLVDTNAEVKQEEGTEAFVITCNPDAANITMEKVFNGFKIRVTIYFTSQRFNAELDGDEQASSGGDVDKEVEESMLPREHCISHLIESRRTGFFTSTAPRLLNCICISRIVKDMIRRDSDWECLAGWPMELTIIKSLSTIGMPETAGDCFRRFMSTVAGGTFLPNGNGLFTVVEKQPRDLTHDWTNQQRESVTFQAQTNLRLLSFRKIHQVLGVVMLPKKTSIQPVKTAPTTGEIKDEPAPQ